MSEHPGKSYFCRAGRLRGPAALLRYGCAERLQGTYKACARELVHGLYGREAANVWVRGSEAGIAHKHGRLARRWPRGGAQGGASKFSWLGWAQGLLH